MQAATMREKRMNSLGKWAGTAVLGIAAFGPSAALSHHSFSMFDVQKEETLSGTVREFQWTNPHSWLQVDVARGGSTVEYSIELGSPNSMSRRGWRRTTFKPGDKITLVMNPMRDGSSGGALVYAIDAQGNRMAWR
jgi:hypothetical protein